VRTSGQDFYKAILYYENCPFATVFCGVVFPGAKMSFYRNIARKKLLV
jgi:hypothetical protein